MKSINLNIILILVSLLLLAGCRKEEKEKNTANNPLPVSVLKVQQDSVLIRKTYPGVLHSTTKADVVGRVNGNILRQHFKAGDYVTKGQVLFTIESSTYQDAVRESAAQVSDAKAAYDYAARHYEAMKRAYSADAVAEMQVIQAKSDMDQAQSQIRQSKAALGEAQTRLGYCTVRAPLSGYISDAVLDPGSYVGGEGNPVTLATIFDNSALEVTFSIPDGAYIQMFTAESGSQKLDFSSMPITFSEQLPHDYSGKISYLAPSINSSTGTLELKARVENPYNELRDGMYATIALPFAAEPHAIIVRDDALQSDQTGSYLYVVNDSNKVIYTPVVTGELYQDTLRIIKSGVKPGEMYVSKALLKVRPGVKVKPIL